MVRFAAGLAVAVACLIGGAGGVWADERALDRARKAIDQLDYAGAQEALAEALASGTNGPDGLAEIYRMTGTVAASLGDSKLATDAFKKLLALRPKATLPAGTSPKISRPFEAAADHFKRNPPLRVRTETTSAPPAVTVVIESDPVAMVAGAKASVVVDGAPERTLEGKGKDKIALELPRGRRIDLRIGVLDEHGNRLVELGSREVPIVVLGDAPARQTAGASGAAGDKKLGAGKSATPRPPRPWYFKWWLWTGAATAFGIGTGYFAFQANLDADELQRLFDSSSSHRVGESTELESRARRDVLLTNIGLGATAVLAAGAAFLYFTEPRGTEPPGRVTVAPALVSGGGTLVVRGGF